MFTSFTTVTTLPEAEGGTNWLRLTEILSDLFFESSEELEDFSNLSTLNERVFFLLTSCRGSAVLVEAGEAISMASIFLTLKSMASLYYDEDLSENSNFLIAHTFFSVLIPIKLPFNDIKYLQIFKEIDPIFKILG